MDKSAQMDNDLDILWNAATIIRNNCIQFHVTLNIAENNVPSNVLTFHWCVIAGDKPIIGARKMQICRFHVFLMCTPFVTLIRKYGSSIPFAAITADHAGEQVKKEQTKHHEGGKAFAKRQSKMDNNRMLSQSSIYKNKFESMMYNLVSNVLLPEEYHAQLLTCDNQYAKLNSEFVGYRLGENPKDNI